MYKQTQFRSVGRGRATGRAKQSQSLHCGLRILDCGFGKPAARRLGWRGPVVQTNPISGSPAGSRGPAVQNEANSRRAPGNGRGAVRPPRRRHRARACETKPISQSRATGGRGPVVQTKPKGGGRWSVIGGKTAVRTKPISRRYQCAKRTQFPAGPARQTNPICVQVLGRKAVMVDWPATEASVPNKANSRQDADPEIGVPGVRACETKPISPGIPYPGRNRWGKPHPTWKKSGESLPRAGRTYKANRHAAGAPNKANLPAAPGG
jgi:hypothetical protein